MKIGRMGERKLIDHIWGLVGGKNEDEDVHFLDNGGKYLLLAMDTINEGFHFERSWNPEQIGKFLVDINLSDIAAKNGIPLELMVSFSFPRDLEETWVSKLVSGMKGEVEKYGLKFSGGDLKEARRISLTGLVIGEVHKGREFRRSGAKPGDYVYISSRIGKQERAIRSYYNGEKGSEGDILDITPRLDLRERLSKAGVTSCIDNSDGIYKSLALISRLSGVRIVIENDVTINSKGERERRSLFSLGGDYELIFTSPRRLRGFPVVGRVVEGKGLVDIDGNTHPPEGFDHFRSFRRP